MDKGKKKRETAIVSTALAKLLWISLLCSQQPQTPLTDAQAIGIMRTSKSNLSWSRKTELIHLTFTLELVYDQDVDVILMYVPVFRV